MVNATSVAGAMRYPPHCSSSPTVSSTGTSPPSHIITRLGQQMRLNGRLLKNIRLGDEVLLNIKMRAQIKWMIVEAGRTRPELVEADRVGQANNMFWLLMNELQDGDGGVDLGEVYGRWCGRYEGSVQQG